MRKHFDYLKKRIQYSFNKYVFIAVVLCIGVLLSFSMFAVIRNAEMQSVKTEFFDGAKDRVEAIYEYVERYLNVFDLIAIFYSASNHIDENEFNIFTAPILEQYPGIQTLYWLPRVTDEQRANWEAQSNMKIVEFNSEKQPVSAARRVDYFPLHYVSKVIGDDRAGIDFKIYADWSTLLKQSIDTKEKVISERFLLPDEKSVDRFSVKVIYPVYKKPQKLIGFIAGVLTLDKIIEHSLKKVSPKGIDILIRNESADLGKRLLYFHASRKRTTPITFEAFENLQTHELQVKKTLSIAKQQWSIECSPIPNYAEFGVKKWSAFIILGGGLAFTIFIVLYSLTLINRTNVLQEEIKKRKQLMAELAARENEFYTFVNNAPVMLWMSNNQGIPTLFNETWLKFTGRTLEQELAQDWLRDLHPNDFEMYLESYKKAFKNHKDFKIIYRFQRQDGMYRWISETTSVRSNAEGKFLGFIGACVDITDQKKAQRALYESQRALETLLSNLPGMAYRRKHDEKWTMEFVSEGCTELTGYQPEEIVNNRRFAFVDLIHFEDKERLSHIEKIALRENRPFKYNYRILDSEGHEKWVWEQGQGVFSDNGELQAVEGFITDVTDQRLAVESLNHAKQLAENANRAKSQFLANMSHELRTPLNAIIGYSEMLKEDAEDLEMIDFIGDLTKIESAGKHLLNIIGDILDISKIESGNIDLQIQTFAVQHLIEETINTIQPMLLKNNNTLDLQVAKNVGTMHSDQKKIRQILLNLLSNATKFTEQGKIVLKVQRERGWMVFRISDNGIGIKPEDQKKLFDTFTQVDNSATRKYGGTGLGLAISYQFSRMIQGNINVHSVFGEGSAFIVRLPIEVKI